MPRKPGTARAQRFWGCLLFLVFGMMTIVSFSDREFYYMRGSYALLTLLFFWMWMRGRRRKRINAMLPDYLMRMTAEPDCTIDSLASSMGKTPAATRQGLLYLYRKHCFRNAYEDKGRACIVFGGNPNLLLSLDPGRQKELDQQVASARMAQQHAVAAPVAAAGAQAVRTVACPGCGAVNHIAAGQPGQCEYCGTAISN